MGACGKGLFSHGLLRLAVANKKRRLLKAFLGGGKGFDLGKAIQVGEGKSLADGDREEENRCQKA